MMHANNVSNFFYLVVVILKVDGKPEEKNKFEGGSSLWIYKPEQVQLEQKINNPAAFNKRALETAVQGSTTELADGTVLEREYKGETHIVRRVDGKYEYKQNRYNSLTEIAWRITGTQCSGPAFFSRRTKIS